MTGMTERTVVDGRPATVAYVTREFEPATRERHDLVKVIFDDGGMMFLTPAVRVEKHLAGQHDQQSHGSRGGGGHPDDADHDPSVISSSVDDLKEVFQLDDDGNNDPRTFDDRLTQVWSDLFPTVFPEDVADAMTGGFATKDKPYMMLDDNGGIIFEFYLKDGTEINRQFHKSEEGLTVYHNQFVIPEAEQGKGIAKQVLRDQMRLYQDVGVKEIYLNANVDGGGYAWAKFGFTPMTRGVAMDWAYVQATTSEELEFLDTVKDSPDPRSIWEVADHPSGKKFLRGSTWAGKLDLSDQVAMKRFKSYVGS